MATGDHERRRAFRCPVDAELQPAELRVGLRRIPVRLYEESAGGFTVRSNRPFPFKAGDLLQLRTAAGRFDVRVVHVSRSKAIDEAQAPAKRLPFQLGLARVRDVADPREASLLKTRWWLPIPRHVIILPRPVNVTQTILLLFIVAMLPVAGVLLASSYKRPLSKWLGSGRYSTSSWPPELEAAPLGPSVESEPGGRRRTSSGTGSLTRMVRRVPDVSAFLLPDVASYLSLDDAQKRQIGQIVQATNKALEQIDRQLAQQSPEARARSRYDLLQAARQEATGLLSNQQRERWSALGQ